MRTFPRKPTIRQVETFRAVMIAGSMKRAALMLSVSQPAVSKIIRSLEDELALPLFLRKKGGLVPSEAAVTLYQETERLYVGLDKIADVAEKLRQRRAGQLRMAAMTAMSLDFLPGLVCRFLRGRPDVSVVVDTHNSPDVVRQVRARHYDLGFTMPPLDRGGIHAEPVQRARCVCILPPGHRLAARKTITTEMLRDEPFISLPEDSVTRVRVDEVFESSAVRRQLHISASSPGSICNFVRDGAGVAIVNPFTATQFAANGGIVKAFLPVIEWPFVRVHPAGMEVTPLQAEFLKLLARTLKPYLV